MISEGTNAWLKLCTSANRIHHHCSVATNTHRCAHRKPNLGQVKSDAEFRKLFQAGSVEEEALQIFMAKKKAADMRDQLRQIIVATRGPSAWDELIKTEADIRKKRQEAIYAQQERRQQVLEIVGIGFLMIVIAGALIGFAYLYSLRN